MDVWAACRDRASPGLLAGHMVRVVESQEQIATTTLVDSLDEQALLEQLLERAKPQLPRDTHDLHYLLATPFRYPPLQYGSRFGTRHQPGLFYGSLQLTTALAETAYYRFVFWQGMATPPPSGRFTTAHTVFGARYRTQRGLRLQQKPFTHYQAQLTDPADYRCTQQLGGAMRETSIEAFEYRSARDPGCGINIGLFSPKALMRSEPTHQQQWLCDTRAESVSFSSKHADEVYHYSQETFLVNDRFPIPAM